MTVKYPSPTPGASLLLSFRLHARTVVVVGSAKHAVNRAYTCLESDAHVVLLGRGGLDAACEEVRWRVEQGQIEWRAVEEEAQRWRTAPAASSSKTDDDEAALHSVLSSLPSVSLVCITDTMIPSTSTATTPAAPARSAASASSLYTIASRIHRIPTNTTDMPALCDFAFPAVHRFRSAKTGEPTALQIGIVTNSKGCRLSSRITREIVARLPKGVGDAVENVGRLRDKAKADETNGREPPKPEDARPPGFFGSRSPCEEQEDETLPLTPNEPVPQRPVAPQSPEPNPGTDVATDETPLSCTQRRMRWVAQVSEYWPIESLASLDADAIDRILSGNSILPPRAVPMQPDANPIAPTPLLHALAGPAPKPARGRILLLGSGPGHPALLTLATARALQTADLVLSDKLVPEAVLQTIPKHVELRIARKFPGNADRAQDELMTAALAAAQQGKIVVRLKQGDPMLYARASSEIAFFTAHSYAPTIIPGLSAAFAAPLSAGIPVTARGVAEGVAICTGVASGGRGGRVPGYARGSTVLVFMGVARLGEIVRGMLGGDAGGGCKREGEGAYPPYIPACIIERGTMPDQRVVQSTLGGIVDAMADPRVGAQRPPGMMVVGWACLGVREGVEGVGDDGGEGLKERDEGRVRKWLGGERFVVSEGLDETWEGL